MSFDPNNLPSSMDLSQIPAGRPPPGVVPNFKNPESLADSVIIVNSIFLALMLVFLTIRIYTKQFIAHGLGWDDYTAIIAGAGSIAHSGLLLSTIRYGLGVHMWDIPLSKLTTSTIRELIALSVVYGPVIFFVKLSILLLYFRIFAVNRIMKYLINFGIIFQTVFYVGYTAVYAATEVKCSGPEALEIAFCMKSYGFVVAQGGVNVATDFYILGLPIFMVSQLQMTLKRKVGVCAVFMAGLLACIVSVVRLVIVIQRLHSTDALWNSAITSNLTAIEINTAIICGAVTALPIFFRRHPILSLSSLSSRLFRRSSGDGDGDGEKTSFSLWTNGRRKKLGAFKGVSLRLPTDYDSLHEVPKMEEGARVTRK